MVSSSSQCEIPYPLMETIMDPVLISREGPKGREDVHIDGEFYSQGEVDFHQQCFGRWEAEEYIQLHYPNDPSVFIHPTKRA